MAVIASRAKQSVLGNTNTSFYHKALNFCAGVRGLSLLRAWYIAQDGLLRHWLDAEAGRVGVGADHADGVAGLPFLADGKGDDGRAVACEVVLSAGVEGWCPGISLLVCLLV